MPKGSGRCLCGAVTFTAGNVETHHHACHCGMCRRWSGGPAFATAADGVAFEGEANIARYDSSEWAQRGFCKICGSSLFYYLKPYDRYIIYVGAFDEPKEFTLGTEIYVDSKRGNYEFAGSHPRLTEADVIKAMQEAGGND